MDEEMDTFSDPSFTASDVACNSCTLRKRKASQTCLQCMASYCEDHLDIHNVFHVNAKRHKLVAATNRLEELFCPEHDKLLDVFCRTDKLCICRLCVTNKHKSHKCVSIENEVAEVKSALGITRKNISDSIKSRENEIQALKEAREKFQIAARRVVVKNEKKFTEMIQFLEMKQGVVKGQVLAQEKAAVKKAKEHLKQLPSEIAHLKKRDFRLQHLGRLSQADNGVYFLKEISSTPALASSLSSPMLFVHPYSSFHLANEAISDLIRQMESVCKLYFAKIIQHVQMADILKPTVLKKRESFLKYVFKLTLNPDTAHLTFRLSKENREVTDMHQVQVYASHPQRFDFKSQILCKEGLQDTPRYWEVDYKVKNWVCIAVSYSKINRKEKNKIGFFGRNNCSWGLRCYYSSYVFWHDNKCIHVNHTKRCSKIGVYLDPGIGILEFYNVSDNMSLIYKVQTKFTEPVYAGFGIEGKGSQITLCDMEEVHNRGKNNGAPETD